MLFLLKHRSQKVQKQVQNEQYAYLDAKYAKADLLKIVQEECLHLTCNEQVSLLSLLQKYEDLFDGTVRELLKMVLTILCVNEF